MQLGQRVRLLLCPLDVGEQQFIGDDNAMIISLTQAGKSPIRACRVRVDMNAMEANRDRVWGGDDPQTVIDDCKTAVVILTSIPSSDLMQVLHAIFHQLFPGSKVDGNG